MRVDYMRQRLFGLTRWVKPSYVIAKCALDHLNRNQVTGQVTTY